MQKVKLSAWITVSELIRIQKAKTDILVTLSGFFSGKRQHKYKTQTFGQTCQLLKEAGVDGFELLIPITASNKNIQQVKQIFEEHDMPVNSIHQSLTSFIHISFTEIERLCKIANLFKTKVVVLHAGALRTKLLQPASIEKLHTLEKKYDIQFGIENMPKAPFNLFDRYVYQGVRFADAVKKANLHITMDTTHLGQVGQDICEFYLANKESIINIHLSDYQHHFMNKHFLLQTQTHLPLTQGNLPIKKFLHLLKKTNYHGLITMEINSNFQQLCESARIITKELM